MLRSIIEYKITNEVDRHRIVSALKYSLEYEPHLSGEDIIVTKRAIDILSRNDSQIRIEIK